MAPVALRYGFCFYATFEAEIFIDRDSGLALRAYPHFYLLLDFIKPLKNLFLILLQITILSIVKKAKKKPVRDERALKISHGLIRRNHWWKDIEYHIHRHRHYPFHD
jgi:hypothetical protein